MMNPELLNGFAEAVRTVVREEFRVIVREELQPIKRRLDKVEHHRGEAGILGRSSPAGDGFNAPSRRAQVIR